MSSGRTVRNSQQRQVSQVHRHKYIRTAPDGLKMSSYKFIKKGYDFMISSAEFWFKPTVTYIAANVIQIFIWC